MRSTSDDGPGLRATVGMVLLLVLCCALPVLIVSGALGLLGSVVGNPWLIGAVALALGTLAALARRRGGSARSGDSACCPPAPSGRNESRPSDHPATH